MDREKKFLPLYGVEIRVLNQAVRRNIERPPKEFMFQQFPVPRDADGGDIVIVTLMVDVIIHHLWWDDNIPQGASKLKTVLSLRKKE
jgi:hypothetical protein